MNTMISKKTRWICQNCGSIRAKWSGQCSQCQEWNSLSETSHEPCSPIVTSTTTPVPLNTVSQESVTRYSSRYQSWDRILGGGAVQGSLILIGGEPGIGKSTLLLQLAAQFAASSLTVFYVCGEESIQQTAMRAFRLHIASPHILLFPETHVEAIQQQLAITKPDILIIDSIQILHSSSCSTPGSVSQIKEITSEFMRIAKQQQITTFIVGHVTKTGDIAGPKVLEHLVDTVLYFEANPHRNYRMIRVVKNRFGPTNELAIFKMTETGLQEILNPSNLFLDHNTPRSAGTAIVPIKEGSEVLLLEIQSLVTKSFFSNPLRKTTGLDANRLALLLAVLEKKAQLNLFQKDIFLSVAGGMKLSDTGADLGICLAIASSLTGKMLPQSTAILGEVALDGSIRNVPSINQKLKEAILLGFQQVIIPKTQRSQIKQEYVKQLTITGISDIQHALKVLQ